MLGDAGRRAVLSPPANPHTQRRLRRRVSAAAVAAAVALTCASLSVSSVATRAGASSIGSDQSHIRELEALVSAEGARIQHLVAASDEVQGRLLVVRGEIRTAHHRLAGDRVAERKAESHLRSVAVRAYVDAASGPSGLLLGSASASADAEQQVYSGVASNVLDAAVAAVTIARHNTSVTLASLDGEQRRLTTALDTLARDERSADAALASEQKTLGGLKGNLVALVTQANERRAEAEEAAEERREAQREHERALRRAPTTTDPAPPPTTTPPPHKKPPPSGAYADPLRAISGLTPERIDMGVDYSGYGPIYAIGDGVVLNTVNGGWPGGTFIVYRLTNGPAAGLFVYAAEDIKPEVSVGEQVTSGTVLGQMYEGPDGIETGWADGAALGETMAAAYGQFSGANSTAFGYNFSQLLEYTGAPGGILQNDPPTGSLPAGWPQW